MLSAARAIWLSLVIVILGLPSAAMAQEKKPADPDPAKTPVMLKDLEDAKAELKTSIGDAKTAGIKAGDTAWMLVSTALVMFMMPGLALFYGGMARRKNVLGTMMHTMVALGLVGVQWVVIGYSLSFGESLMKAPESSPIEGSLIGFSPELICLSSSAAIGSDVDTELKAMKIDPAKATDDQKKAAQESADKKSKYRTFPNTNLPLYLHAMFQGMFAIITVALVSGAFAERVKFGTYCLFALLWTTLVYDPIAHWVWSFGWTKLKPDDPAFPAAGLLGANGAIDFAGGTVVHIAAGVSGLASILILRKRNGYGKQTFHPNSMVLTLLGAGMLWFGWFGFNGGSALFSNAQAVSAFTVTQIAAATAGLAWVIVEWLHRGKPTALGFASGLVAGLVAITPASGFVAPSGALAIGAIAGVACYWSVNLKSLLGYDDSLDAFGIHGVGGMIGAVLTGVFVCFPLWKYGADVAPDLFPGKFDKAADGTVTFKMIDQVKWQIIACACSAVYAFVVTSVLVVVLEYTIGFTCSAKDEAAGLDLSQHGETGFDMGPDVDAGAVVEPKSAMAPPVNGGGKRFTVVVEGQNPEKLMAAWSKLCQTGDSPPSKEFRAVYPYVTTVSGNKFRFRGGDPVLLKDQLKKLFDDSIGGGTKTHVES